MASGPSTLLLICAVLLSVSATAQAMMLIRRPLSPRVHVQAHDRAADWARTAMPWMLLLLSTLLCVVGMRSLFVDRDVSDMLPNGSHAWLIPMLGPLAGMCLVRLVGPKVDADLTARCRRIARNVGVGFGCARVIEIGPGRKRIHESSEGSGRWLALVFSRRLVQLLTPEEMSFLCARRLARARLVSGGSGDVAIPIMLSIGVGLLYFTFPHLRALILPVLVPTIAYYSAIIVVACLMDRDLPKGKDLRAEADLLALRAIGRLDVAESCLLKLRANYATNAELELGKEIPSRIEVLRRAAQEIGIDPREEWVSR